MVSEDVLMFRGHIFFVIAKEVWTMVLLAKGAPAELRGHADQHELACHGYLSWVPCEDTPLAEVLVELYFSGHKLIQ